LLDDVSVHLVDDVETAYACKRWLSTCDKVALDTEATGLDKDRDKARLVQLGDAREAYVIPIEWDGWGGLVIELLRRYEGTYVLHNRPYDDAMIFNSLGVRLPQERTHDTRLKAHVLDSVGSLALKKLATKYVDPRAGMLQDDLSEVFQTGSWTWATIPWNFEKYWFYAGMDTVLTYQLDDYLDPLVQAEAPVAYELELAVSYVTERMERNGVLVDREYTQRFMDDLNHFMREAERWCSASYGVYPGSNQAVIAALQRENIEFIKYTDAGKLSLDKYVLGAINHPLAQVVLERRQAQKMVSTYLQNYLEMSIRDGRIHPSINTVGGTDKNPFEPGGGGRGVRTGRMSMSDPNLQNVPIRGRSGKRLRRCFVAEEGKTWIKCDADQIEMRGMAHMSQDQRMIEAFLNEGDFFVNIARQLFNEPNFEKSDPRRQLIKNGGYAKIYGAGIPKFAATAGVSEDVARPFMRDFDDMFEDVPRWIRQVERDALDRLANEGEAYIRSPLTNRKHVADEGKLYTLVNYVIQGTAGEILKMKMVEADQAGLGEFMRLPVHDEIDLEVPNDQLEDALATLSDVVNDDQLLTVPLTWSAETGPNWGDCS
jgi:DNA polymerase I-like protein with 3'-5' exonuclease and polymerase domains